MMDVTHRIKNLSIALEAISHVLGDCDTMRCGIEDLLKYEIKAQEKENKEKYKAAKSITDDDDIPF